MKRPQIHVLHAPNAKYMMIDTISSRLHRDHYYVLHIHDLHRRYVTDAHVGTLATKSPPAAVFFMGPAIGDVGLHKTCESSAYTLICAIDAMTGRASQRLKEISPQIVQIVAIIALDMDFTWKISSDCFTKSATYSARSIQLPFCEYHIKLLYKRKEMLGVLLVEFMHIFYEEASAVPRADCDETKWWKAIKGRYHTFTMNDVRGASKYAQSCQKI